MATKSTTKIFREVSNARTQFWASCVEKDGKIAVVTTNLPVKETPDGLKADLRPIPEREGIGLQAVRMYAESKNANILAAKVVIDNLNEQKEPIVLFHKVTPVKKGNKYVFDLERCSVYKGGFPEGTIFSKLSKAQLFAFGIDPETFKGEKAKLQSLEEIQANKSKAKNKAKLVDALNNLGVVIDSAIADKSEK